MQRNDTATWIDKQTNDGIAELLYNHGSSLSQQAPAPNATTVQLTLADFSGFEVTIRMKSESSFKKAMNCFASRSSHSLATLRFLFEGERLHGDSTPAEYDMVNGDRIEVHSEQIGG